MPYQGFVDRQEMVRVVPFDEPSAASCAAPTRGPTAEERALYESHRHLRTAAGAGELQRLLALQTRATSLAVKLERDALRAAVAESCGTYSAFTLFWAATVMDANARAGRARPWADSDMDLRRDAWPAMVRLSDGRR
jgi:hypothetical protein